MKTLAEDEEARVAKQRQDLGKDGLQKKADVLEKATEQNEVGELKCICLQTFCI